MPEASLAPSASETCTATYTVTQADLDAGAITNVASAQGTAPGADTPTVSSPSSVTITGTQTPAVTLVKSATESTYSAPGQTIHFNYLVTNTGNVTLSAISVNDTFTGLTGLSCPEASLAPSASETCTATYTVTQADLDAGAITNVASAQGTAPGADTPTVSDPSTVTIPVDPTPVVATSATTGPVVVGSPIADTTTVTGVDGSGLPTGTVAFYVCGPTTSTGLCASTSNPVGTASVPAPSDTGLTSTASSGTFTPTVSGFYCFAAVFTRPMAGTTPKRRITRAAPFATTSASTWSPVRRATARQPRWPPRRPPHR